MRYCNEHYRSNSITQKYPELQEHPGPGRPSAQAGRCRQARAQCQQSTGMEIVTEPDLVAKVDMFSPGLSGHPPVILVICSDMEYALGHSRNAEIYGCMMDASMAAENIMLAALEEGLGTCAIKSYTDAAVRKLLCLPDTYRIEMLMSIGYPEGDPRDPRRKPLEEILYFNQWEENK